MPRPFPFNQEIWNVEAGRLIHKGKAAVVEDAFEEMAAKEEKKANSRTASRMASRAASKAGTPVTSAPASAANSGDEDAGAAQLGPDGVPMPVVKKKKLTRKQMKEREERRRLRTLAFLSNSIPGAKRESDTESD